MKSLSKAITRLLISALSLLLPPNAYADYTTQQLLDKASLHFRYSDFVDNDNGLLRTRVHDHFLFLEGTINSRSYDRIINLLKDQPQINTLVFTSAPGSSDDEANIELGRYLYDNNYTTLLPKQGHISSDGVDLLLSGRTRIIEKGARAGVHSWATEDEGEILSSRDFPKNHEIHNEYLDYYRYINIS